MYTDGFEGKKLISITFHTNRGTYGPFGPASPVNEGQEVMDFSYQVGGTFGGFFGTYRALGIESIGFYMMPLRRIGNQRMANSLIFSYDY